MRGGDSLVTRPTVLTVKRPGTEAFDLSPGSSRLAEEGTRARSRHLLRPNVSRARQALKVRAGASSPDGGMHRMPPIHRGGFFEGFRKKIIIYRQKVLRVLSLDYISLKPFGKIKQTNPNTDLLRAGHHCRDQAQQRK